MPVLVAHCRAGFEVEAAHDLEAIATQAGTTVSVDAPPRRAFVIARPDYYARRRWAAALAAATPIFVRSLFVGGGPHALFDPGNTRGRPDRAAPLATRIAALRAAYPLPAPMPPFGELRLEVADTNEGKELSAITRGLATPLATALRASGALAADNATQAPCVHVLLVDGAHVYVGTSAAPWSSRWPMGIPRLAMPRGAPSRSTLKLAEAFVTFLGEREPELLRAGMKAVDLGAAPGGWSWQLARRGLRVTAVDNGPLKGDVAHDRRITHLARDGLTYRPPRPVDWMVCDIALSPARIAALVARWIADGDARRSIFNLKLPMKKRYDETLRCRALLEERVAQARIRYRLSLRQLYHDREEVTGYIERIDASA